MLISTDHNMVEYLDTLDKELNEALIGTRKNRKQAKKS